MSLSAAGAEAGKLGGDAFHLGQKFPGGVLPGARVIDKKQGGIPAVRVHRRGGAAVAEGYRGRISPGDAELIGPALRVIKGLGGSVVIGLWREAPDKDRQKDRRQNRKKTNTAFAGRRLRRRAFSRIITLFAQLGQKDASSGRTAPQWGQAFTVESPPSDGLRSDSVFPGSPGCTAGPPGPGGHPPAFGRDAPR